MTNIKNIIKANNLYYYFIIISAINCDFNNKTPSDINIISDNKPKFSEENKRNNNPNNKNEKIIIPVRSIKGYIHKNNSQLREISNSLLSLVIPREFILKKEDENIICDKIANNILNTTKSIALEKVLVSFNETTRDVDVSLFLSNSNYIVKKHIINCPLSLRAKPKVESKLLGMGIGLFNTAEKIIFNTEDIRSALQKNNIEEINSIINIYSENENFLYTTIKESIPYVNGIDRVVYKYVKKKNNNFFKYHIKNILPHENYDNLMFSPINPITDGSRKLSKYFTSIPTVLDASDTIHRERNPYWEMKFAEKGYLHAKKEASFYILQRNYPVTVIEFLNPGVNFRKGKVHTLLDNAIDNNIIKSIDSNITTDDFNNDEFFNSYDIPDKLKLPADITAEKIFLPFEDNNSEQYNYVEYYGSPNAAENNVADMKLFLKKNQAPVIVDKVVISSTDYSIPSNILFTQEGCVYDERRAEEDKKRITEMTGQNTEKITDRSIDGNTISVKFLVLEDNWSWSFWKTVFPRLQLTFLQEGNLFQLKYETISIYNKVISYILNGKGFIKRTLISYLKNSISSENNISYQFQGQVLKEIKAAENSVNIATVLLSKQKLVPISSFNFFSIINIPSIIHSSFQVMNESFSKDNSFSINILSDILIRQLPSDMKYIIIECLKYLFSIEKWKNIYNHLKSFELSDVLKNILNRLGNISNLKEKNLTHALWLSTQYNHNIKKGSFVVEFFLPLYALGSWIYPGVLSAGIKSGTFIPMWIPFLRRLNNKISQNIKSEHSLKLFSGIYSEENSIKENKIFNFTINQLKKLLVLFKQEGMREALDNYMSNNAENSWNKSLKNAISYSIKNNWKINKFLEYEHGINYGIFNSKEIIPTLYRDCSISFKNDEINSMDFDSFFKFSPSLFVNIINSRIMNQFPFKVDIGICVETIKIQNKFHTVSFFIIKINTPLGTFDLKIRCSPFGEKYDENSMRDNIEYRIYPNLSLASAG